jgi:uncharacterized protein (TIGR03086 family)
MLDLRPVTRTMATLVAGVRDDQLGDPTPCADLSLGDLLDHVDGLSLAFTMAAAKQVPVGGSRRPEPDGARLGGDWRASIGLALDRLAEAWARPDAWAGTTEVGGLVMPGEVAGLVAVDEVLVHGWDVAVASGQPVGELDPATVDAVHDYLAAMVGANPDGTPGVFGPPVPVPADAGTFEALIGLTGRDPGWRSPTRGER